ncbi:NAD-dependent epimerase/dehydratase family protein [Ferdinandcohnia sp. Marseille-Q9671]
MKLLILGGTKFLGKHLVLEALKRGHEVTLFNRGKSNPTLFPEIETIIGDRDSDLKGLEGRTWDAVIDPSGYVPRIVQKSVEKLKNHVKHYTFISTISVYEDYSHAGISETDPVSTLQDHSVEEVTGETYGPLKALCEEVVKEQMPEQQLTIRPGLIVGPDDPTDRFTYWPMRFYDGGDILVPNCPNQPIQWIDVRDLASWTLHLIENKSTGTYNAVGPSAPYTFGEFLDECKNFSSKETQVHSVEEDFLLKNEVGMWVEIPFWLPSVPGENEMKGMLQINNSKAIENGLTVRPLKETIEATIKWNLNEKGGEVTRAGLSKEREKELLHKWHSFAENK